MGFTIHTYQITHRNKTYKFTYDADNRIKNWKYVWRGWANNPINNKKHWTSHYKSYNGALEHARDEMRDIIVNHIENEYQQIERQAKAVRDAQEAKKRAEELEKKMKDEQIKQMEIQKEKDRLMKEEQERLRKEINEKEEQRQQRENELKNSMKDLINEMDDMKQTNKLLSKNQEMMANYIVNLMEGVYQFREQYGIEVQEIPNGITKNIGQ